MVTIEIVINSTYIMGIRVTISCRYYIAFKLMLLFLVFVVVFIFHTVSAFSALASLIEKT